MDANERDESERAAAAGAGACGAAAGDDARAWSRVLGAVLLALALVALVAPQLLAHRFGPQPTRELEAFWQKCMPIARSLAVPLAAIGLVLVRGRGGVADWRWPAGLAALCYAALCVPFFDWIIDDAGISFAYAENLVRGHGLVLHPAHRPEEGYSNLLWVLVLAAFRVLGADVAVTAKVLGVALGALTIALAVRTAVQESGASEELLLPAGALLAAAPYVIWTSSGLENAIVGVLTMWLVVAPHSRHPRAVTAAALALFILVRPEAPLFVAAVVAAEVIAAPGGLVRGVKEQLGVVLVPLAVMALQHAFRVAYFHDPMPNPYYAKVSGLNPLRLVNVFGGGWIYTLAWLRSTHVLVIVPLLALAVRWPASPVMRRVFAVLAAQLAFVLMVNGDWMKGWRFFATGHAPLAVWVTVALAGLAHTHGAMRARALALVITAMVGLATVSGLVDFRWAPVTPMARIAELAEAFNDLARRLGIERPRIAWHDSGGSSYRARIDVVDLGGLGNRDIARNKTDREYMRRYLFEQTRPAFFISDDKAFAALWCAFHQMDEFRRDYAPLELPARLGPPAPILAIRRELARDVPGVRVIRSASGAIERVIVE